MHRTDFDPDRELAFVDDLLAGDSKSVDRFTERLSCVPRMLASRNARVGRPLPAEELQDLAQDTFVVILRQLPGYKPLAPLESWIYGICCLQFKAALRRRTRLRQQARSLAEEEPPAPEGPATTRIENAEEVHSLLAELPSLEADVLRLKHLEGLTFEALGERLKLSPNTVKTVYYRGLAAVRDCKRQRPDFGEEKRA